MRDYSSVKDFKESKHNGFSLKIYENAAVLYHLCTKTFHEKGGNKTNSTVSHNSLKKRSIKKPYILV